MCLTLKDSTPGKPVAIEGCRGSDNKQVGFPVASMFLSTVFHGNARLIFILSSSTCFNECHSLKNNKQNGNKTVRNRRCSRRERCRHGKGCDLHFLDIHYFYIPLIHLVCSPKLCVTFVSHISWALPSSQDKLKTTLMQILGSRQAYWMNVTCK